MSNSSSQIAEKTPATTAQVPAQPIPLDAELLKLISGGGAPGLGWAD